MAVATLVEPTVCILTTVMDLAVGSPGCRLSCGSVAPWISSGSAQHHWQQHWQLVMDLCTFATIPATSLTTAFSFDIPDVFDLIVVDLRGAIKKFCNSV